MKLLSWWDVFSGCAWYRCIVPAYHAAQAGRTAHVRQGEITKPEVAWCDTLVVQRLFQPEALDAIRYANALGKTTVYDLDDDIWCLSADNPAADFWKTHADDAIPLIRECTRVTTTTESLAEGLRRLNPNVSIIPNYLPDAEWPKVQPANTDILGWAGAQAHRSDLGLISDVLYEAAESGWTVALAGACADWVPWHIRIQHWACVDISDYSMLLSGFGVGLAPLVDNRFNRAKSDLKVLEYAACSLPVIASPHYEDTPARIARNGKDWRRHIKALRDPDLRREEGARMRAWAETRMMSGHLAEWERAWSAT